MMASSNFSKLQFLAWFDFLSFFIIIGPTFLIFLAASGLNPTHHLNTVTRTNVTVHLLLYQADRNMTAIELQILQRVRAGCGRHYIRNLIKEWDSGYLVQWAFGCIIFAICAPPISALVFLMAVPGNSALAKLVPLGHLIIQLASVSCSLVGNYILTKSSLCFLNYVFKNFHIQTTQPILAAGACLTYKVYEIKILVHFCKEHFTEWKTEEFIKGNTAEDMDRLVKQLEELEAEGKEDVEEDEVMTDAMGNDVIGHEVTPHQDANKEDKHTTNPKTVK